MTEKIETFKGLGSLSKLSTILAPYVNCKILVVTGKQSFELCGASVALKEILKSHQATYFDDFEVNPKLDDALNGVKLAIAHKVELIIGIGGGSVLDMAKLIKAFYCEPVYSTQIAKGKRPVIDCNIPMIAVPTTAGSGSEATHFAVVYVDNKKYSVADNCLLPATVVLDGQLLSSASRSQKAYNVLDAISQAIESAWAVGATEESRELAFQSLKMSIESFHLYVNDSASLDAAQSMIEASHLAGKAINISKTTSAHAWSYGFSSLYDIPHGHAVWLTLPKIFQIHDDVETKAEREIRGQQYFRDTISKLRDVIGIGADMEVVPFFNQMLNSIGVKAGITDNLDLSSDQKAALSNSANNDRMTNNPVIFSDVQIKLIFEL
ncbi:phosphonoacetaldehyde reductase [Luminiphilus sp.]|nr:phosphonoacetaldehyde reductase [Luminiphilus sp.]